MAIGGAIVTAIVSFPLSAWLADKFYMRFMFSGDLGDFASGDSFGELLVFGAFEALSILATVAIWLRVYRRFSSLG